MPLRGGDLKGINAQCTYNAPFDSFTGQALAPTETDRWVRRLSGARVKNEKRFGVDSHHDCVQKDSVHNLVAITWMREYVGRLR